MIKIILIIWSCIVLSFTVPMLIINLIDLIKCAKEIKACHKELKQIDEKIKQNEERIKYYTDILKTLEEKENANV